MLIVTFPWINDDGIPEWKTVHIGNRLDLNMWLQEKLTVTGEKLNEEQKR